MAEIMLDVNKTEMNRIQRLANRILEKKGIDPDVYFYKIHHEIVFENIEDILDDFQKIEDKLEEVEEKNDKSDKAFNEFKKGDEFNEKIN